MRLYIKLKTNTTECTFSPRRIERIENYVNRVRSQARSCGADTYPAAPAVTWNQKLYLAAQTHSSDMAENNFFNHKNLQGLSPSDRVSNENYKWKSVAENIAGGTDTPEQTIEQWLSSPGHCYNLMNSSHTQIALACKRNNISDYRIYWTMILASPNS